MTDKDRKEFFEKFIETAGHTTKHYEFKDVDPLELVEWIEAKKREWEGTVREEYEDQLFASRLLWDRMEEWRLEYLAEHPDQKDAGLYSPDALRLIEWKIDREVTK